MTSNYEQTANWLAACGKTPGDEKHLSVAIGVFMEEISECLKTIYIESNTGITTNAVQELAAHLEACANTLKKGYATAKIYDREMALDGLCDIEVTVNGVAYLAGMNKPEADRRVLASNRSKLDENGRPVILEGGKIGKSHLYKPVDFSDLV